MKRPNLLDKVLGIPERLKLLEQVSSLSETVNALGDQIAKLTRLQYKGTHEILSRIEEVGQSIRDEAGSREDLILLKERVVSRLLNWLDSLDVLMNEGDKPLTETLAHWRADIVEALADIGLQEVPVLGLPFDPRYAEAVGTVSRDDPLSLSVAPRPLPYLVVKVLRRGFEQRENQRVFRKAHVITVQEGENNVRYPV